MKGTSPLSLPLSETLRPHEPNELAFATSDGLALLLGLPGHRYSRELLPWPDLATLSNFITLVDAHDPVPSALQSLKREPDALVALCSVHFGWKDIMIKFKTAYVTLPPSGYSSGFPASSVMWLCRAAACLNKIQAALASLIIGAIKAKWNEGEVANMRGEARAYILEGTYDTTLCHDCRLWHTLPYDSTTTTKGSSRVSLAGSFLRLALTNSEMVIPFQAPVALDSHDPDKPSSATSPSSPSSPPSPRSQSSQRQVRQVRQVRQACQARRAR